MAMAGRPLRVLLAAPRGFCAGVRRAIEAVETALAHYGPPVYVRRPIVHNRAVMARLEAIGAVFVEELDEVPDGAVVVMSAHGIPRAVAKEADRRGLVWFDAVCPLVGKVHREVMRHHRAGRHVILIGHRGHPEIVGTLGQLPAGAAISVVASTEEVAALPLAADRSVAYAVQTTYSVDEAEDVIAAIRARFGDVAGPPGSDICYATTNRQAAIREIAARVDAVIVASTPVPTFPPTPGGWTRWRAPPAAAMSSSSPQRRSSISARSTAPRPWALPPPPRRRRRRCGTSSIASRGTAR
jgi:4-hydroxy-3-methylbut-2-enyl diphosphate reductase